ncbi:MAG: cytochrome c3 family protein [Polyangiaceae bacterium]|nr:cytochrome c3 family protein [Polyangiaceae bacterium]MCB9607726.1 cytochrome c3 family protein [Polyangiaceae bacterium]
MTTSGPTRSSQSLTWLFWAALVFAAVFAACSTPPPPPRFPHEKHLEELPCGGPGQRACLNCNTCHTVSETRRDDKLPEPVLCETCHQKDAQTAVQALKAIPERPYGEILFNHDQHLALPKLNGQCVGCHSGIVEGAKRNIPAMSECFKCHEHQAEWDRGECVPCHAKSDLKRITPQSFLRHDASFLKHHGVEAVQQKQLCQSCHAKQDCEGCHDASQDLSIERRRPEALGSRFVHRGDFISRHAIEAQASPAKCQRCHEPSTCDACHTRRGVSANSRSSRNPHPPEWVGNSASIKSLHGKAARRDLLSCASCHEQGPATNCIRCHKVGAYGGNPHPGGWRSSRGETTGMCGYCHE